MFPQSGANRSLLNLWYFADMSNSQQTNVIGTEEVPLTIIAGAGDEQKDNALTQVSSRIGRVATFCYKNKHQRTLAYCSIICGCSCIGVKALTNSVKVLHYFLYMIIKQFRAALNSDKLTVWIFKRKHLHIEGLRLEGLLHHKLGRVLVLLPLGTALPFV